MRAKTSFERGEFEQFFAEACALFGVEPDTSATRYRSACFRLNGADIRVSVDIERPLRCANARSGAKPLRIKKPDLVVIK